MAKQMCGLTTVPTIVLPVTDWNSGSSKGISSGTWKAR